jgi:O-acetylhomoserine/O-acetylserine sulfhydrylase-like pyridoxal-dependent enzyme
MAHGPATLALRAGLSQDVVRLPVGLEHVTDLTADLERPPAVGK